MANKEFNAHGAKNKVIESAAVVDQMILNMQLVLVYLLHCI